MALAPVREARGESKRTQALVKLSPLLSEPLLKEAFEAALAIQASRKKRTEALTRLAPYLPTGMLAEARAIRDVDERTIILAGLAPRLAALPTVTLYSMWPDTLHVLATRTRQDLLADIHALSPVIARLGGQEAVAETFRAIQDVGRWWP